MGLNILIIGNCGVGKTHIIKKIIEHLNLTKSNRVGLLNYHENENYIVTGKYDGGIFEGSDRLSMSVMTSLDEFMEVNKDKIIFYEGDRFMNSNFIKKAQPFIVKVLGNGAEGREKRGSNQTKRHLSSIATRVNNIESNLDLKDSQLCIEVLTDCLWTSNNATELKGALDYKATKYEKDQKSLF